MADGCFNAIFEGTVLTLHQAELLDVSIIHGDGTTTAAKKGGDNIGEVQTWVTRKDELALPCRLMAR